MFTINNTSKGVQLKYQPSVKCWNLGSPKILFERYKVVRNNTSGHALLILNWTLDTEQWHLIDTSTATPTTSACGNETPRASCLSFSLLVHLCFSTAASLSPGSENVWFLALMRLLCGPFQRPSKKRKGKHLTVQLFNTNFLASPAQRTEISGWDGLATLVGCDWLRCDSSRPLISSPDRLTSGRWTASKHHLYSPSV